MPDSRDNRQCGFCCDNMNLKAQFGKYDDEFKRSVGWQTIF